MIEASNPLGKRRLHWLMLDGDDRFFCDTESDKAISKPEASPTPGLVPLGCVVSLGRCGEGLLLVRKEALRLKRKDRCVTFGVHTSEFTLKRLRPRYFLEGSLGGELKHLLTSF